MPETPLSRYQRDLLRDGFVADAAQLNAVNQLNRLYHQLIETQDRCFWSKRNNGGVLARALRSMGLGRRAKLEVKGLYFWGGVGRGKTYLMDIFFESLPFKAKLRTHFHRFMRRVHQELGSLKGQQNPLDIVADRFAAEARVICFDEFFVVDITDAMILAKLLEHLFARGVVLVATSNIEPKGLYENGLQRVRFLPAIDLLNQQTDVVNVDGGVDYRLRTLEKAALFYDATKRDTQAQLRSCFDDLAPNVNVVKQGIALEVEGRAIVARFVADDIAWFDFAELCDGPRSQNDYIELAREFHAVIVDGVPTFTAGIDDQARRFIYLVDEFYDRNVKLIISAESTIQQLYQDGRLSFEFQRTVSRLQEMQSKEYLARAHRP
ncbi:cell division protein ZapE [Teredinibacter haidensis]|uniref:cell division protein ZapE n=1 Tax=Teredinibacter haidensis TaxID=2731755 RepID=UPI0009490880